MKSATMAVAISLVSINAAIAKDLDGLAVSVIPSLSHFSVHGQLLTVGVEVSNSTPSSFSAIIFECVGFADGLPVARSVGIASNIGAYRSEYADTTLMDYSKKPTEMSCRITNARVAN